MRQEAKLTLIGLLSTTALSAYAQGGAPGGSVTWIVFGGGFAGGFLGALLACWLCKRRGRDGSEPKKY